MSQKASSSLMCVCRWRRDEVKGDGIKSQINLESGKSTSFFWGVLFQCCVVGVGGSRFRSQHNNKDICAGFYSHKVRAIKSSPHWCPCHSLTHTQWGLFFNGFDSIWFRVSLTLDSGSHHFYEVLGKSPIFFIFFLLFFCEWRTGFKLVGHDFKTATLISPKSYKNGLLLIYFIFIALFSHAWSAPVKTLRTGKKRKKTHSCIYKVLTTISNPKRFSWNQTPLTAQCICIIR